MPTFAKRSLVLPVTLLLLAASHIRAQENDRKFELFVQGGPSFYTSGSNTVFFVGPPLTSTTLQNSLGTTGRLFTGARFFFNPKEALEASYSYSPNRLQSTFEIGPPFSFVFFDSTSMRVHQAQFNYVRYVPWGRRGRLEPFVTAGLGFVTYAIAGDRNTKFAGNFGGGVDVRLHPRWRLRAEFRDVVAERPEFGFVTGTAHNLVPSVGIALKLW